MKSEDFIAELKEDVEKLLALLNDPQPGISSWWLMLGDKIAFIKEYGAIGESKRLLSPMDKTYDRGHCYCGKWLGRGLVVETAPEFCSAKCKKGRTK